MLSELLARLVSVPAPPALRRLQDISEAMLDRVPAVVGRLDGDDRRLVQRCAAAVAGTTTPPARGRYAVRVGPDASLPAGRTGALPESFSAALLTCRPADCPGSAA
jgi:hypothetical protein